VFSKLTYILTWDMYNIHGVVGGWWELAEPPLKTTATD